MIFFKMHKKGGALLILMMDNFMRSTLDHTHYELMASVPA